MNLTDVRFVLNPDDPKSNVVEVAGVNVAAACRSLKLTVEGSNLMPRLTLDLFVTTATHHGPAFVDVPEDTRAALIAIGWTPPPTDEVKRARDVAALLVANPIYAELARQANERGLECRAVQIELDDQYLFQQDGVKVRVTFDLLPAEAEAS